MATLHVLSKSYVQLSDLMRVKPGHLLVEDGMKVLLSDPLCLLGSS